MLRGRRDRPVRRRQAPGAPLIERWDGRHWTLVHGPAAGAGLTSVLPFPPSVDRAPATGSASTRLISISCASPRSCAAVGVYTATNGAVGPLAANWNGSSWSQIALRRGPVQLNSVSCPVPGWCMAAGGPIAERWIG